MSKGSNPLSTIKNKTAERGVKMCGQDYLDDLYDYCDECRIYGDDYSFDEDGNMICMCDTCINNLSNWDDGYWIGDDE